MRDAPSCKAPLQTGSKPWAGALVGGFYGGIHVRTDDQQEVVEAVKTLGGRYLVGPCLQGWVAVYPEHGGQDEKVSASLAEQLPHNILHLLVHDDDVFVYYYYCEHLLRDQFDTRPDHVGPLAAAESARWQPHPERLEHLLQRGKQASDIAKVLSQSEGPILSPRLARFARLFDIPNALTSFEYLENQELYGIRGWKQFVRVPPPDLGPHHEARGMQRKLTADKIQVAGRKLSLGACVAASATGFWLATDATLLRWQAPWKKPVDCGLGFTLVKGMAETTDRRYLALAAASRDYEGWRVRVLEQDSLLLAGERTAAECGSLEYSAPHDQLIMTDSNSCMVLSLPTLQVQYKTSVDRLGKAIRHPREPWVVVLQGDRLTLWNLEQNHSRVLWAGGKDNVHPISQALAARVQREMSQLSDESVLEKFAGMKLPPKQRADMDQRVRQTVVGMQQLVGSGAPVSSARGRQLWFDVAFDGDGRSLLVAGREGVSALDWAQLRSSADSTPTPRWHCPALYSYSLCCRPGHLIFVTHPGMRDLIRQKPVEGSIVVADVETGAVLARRQVTVKEVINRVALSADGRLLATIQTDLHRGHRAPQLALYDLDRL